MDPSNLNILVEARKEYLGQLYLVMCPHIIEAFEDMYKESYKKSGGKKVLIQFQTFLKEVVNWNDHMIKQHTDAMCNSCSWFSDLLAAVFVSSVKILSSVRLNSTSNKISLKLPTNQVFIHGCFINVSKDLYKNPYIYHEEHTEQERDIELIERISKSIESTVKEMIPVQEILKSCISQEAKKESIDFTNELPQDDEDPDVIDDEPDGIPDYEPEGEPEGEPVGESTGEPEGEETTPPTNKLESDNSAEHTSGPDMKNIDIIKKPQPQPVKQEEDDVLFNDAPEQR